MNFDFSNLCMNCMTFNTDPNHKCRSNITTSNLSLPMQTILSGRYLVGSLLGCGGFGMTYIALDLKEEKRVAIKEFFPSEVVTRFMGNTFVQVINDSNEEAFKHGLSSFINEARTVYKFNNNPNIISVHDLFEENYTAYFVMEYLDGQTFKSYLDDNDGKIDIVEALNVLLPLFDVLTEIHGHKLIHRDISPDNIYITNKKEIKLIDFGSARFAIEEKSQNLSQIVKFSYSPIEQFLTKGKQGPWTDVYSLAATIYRAITGERVLNSTDRAVKDELKSPLQLGIKIEPYINKALMTALQVSPDTRYKTVAEFKKDLIMGEMYSLNASKDKSNQVKKTSGKVDSKVSNNISNKGPKQNSNPNINPNVVSKKPDNLQKVSNTEKNVINSAGFFRRTIATLIDLVFITIIVYFANIASNGAALLLYIAYYTFFESSSRMGTLGKLITSTKVLDEKNNKLTLSRAFIRCLARIVTTISIVGYFTILFSKEKLSLHDMISKTYVLKRK